ncbi:MAG: putative transcriptional regulator, TetR family [Chlamydiales bacterium]|jgi:AcrR family transcriptional regulator|nr:putative transcriptional regulator, TetR family [Chlamydiales bacterium]
MTEVSENQKEMSTLEKILQAAKELFIANGFEGTSISAIAKRAGINQSLIYHHFKSKVDLWKCVKRRLFETYTLDYVCEVNLETSLKDFLVKTIEACYKFYKEKSDVIRMINWQRLEAPGEELKEGTPYSPETWLKGVEELQRQGKIRRDLPPIQVAVFISSLVEGMYWQEHLLSHSRKEGTLPYLDVIMDLTYKALKTT